MMDEMETRTVIIEVDDYAEMCREVRNAEIMRRFALNSLDTCYSGNGYTVSGTDMARLIESLYPIDFCCAVDALKERKKEAEK